MPFATGGHRPMIRILVPWIISTLENVDALDKIEAGKPIAESFTELFQAHIALETTFGADSIYGPHLRASRPAASSLYDRITAYLNDPKVGESRIDEFGVQLLKAQKDQFRTVFLADLGVLPLYIVTRKGNYDVAFLIEEGIGLFPLALKAKAPEAADDAREVGRALAFELSTAAGFHTFRIIESVVRRYWDQVSNGAARPNLQTLGSLAAEMEKQNFGDIKVVEAIKQMTKLHRNPLIHPEVILTVDEAIGIIGMANSVMALMLRILPDSQPTTGASPVVAVPSP